MSDLLPTGSSQLERQAAAACSGISSLAVPLRDLWNPDTCPVTFLPYLAWAFSVDRWDEKWPAAEKRRAVKDAFYIHRRKGTVAAIRRVIENLGYTMTIQEWWQVADPAGTFRLTVDLQDVGITDEMVNELERLIGDAKPVSRHIVQLSLQARVKGGVYYGAAVAEGNTTTIYPLGYEPDGGIIYDGTAWHNGSVIYTGKKDVKN